MTAGGLIQIVTATGEQDLYLTGSPEFTLFRNVIRKHTNFAIETVEEVFYSGVDFGRQCRCLIPRVGDLITDIVVYAKLGSLNYEFYKIINSSKNTKHKLDSYNRCACAACLEEQYKDELIFGYVNSLGHALLKSMWIEIGGVRMDKQYGEWLEIWSELTLTEEKRLGYFNMIGKVNPTSFTATTFTGSMELYIPLNFWFCRNIGLALPIMSLVYHKVELVVDFRDFNELWVSSQCGSKPELPKLEATLLIDYVYLDIDERRKFYQESRIYLFEQLQFSYENSVIGSNENIDLYFNHPVKELVWVLQRNDVTTQPNGVYPRTNYPIGNDWFNFSPFQTRRSTVIQDTFKTALLQFNGVDRFRRREASYFRLLEPYKRHTRIPNNYIYVYSFGFDPENIQPSGHMNFSRVDHVRINLTLPNKRNYTNYNLRCYAINYNVIIFSAGMAGLLFTN